MTPTYLSVGTITRLGRRSDGEPWHYGTFNEDGSIDLPPGTQLYVLINPPKESHCNETIQPTPYPQAPC